MPLSVKNASDMQLPNVMGLADGGDENFLGVILSHPHADHYGLLTKAPRTPVLLMVVIRVDVRYLIDHVIPLACGGLNSPKNIQWQPSKKLGLKIDANVWGVRFSKPNGNYVGYRTVERMIFSQNIV